MYLHIGQDTVVRFDDIIGIFDIDTASVSSQTREFLKGSQEKDEVVSVGDELPKSFLVCSERVKGGAPETKVYISQISSTTLLKRAEIGGMPREGRE